MDQEHGALAGKRILIVEDELLVAMDLEDLLEEHGCRIIDTVSTVENALRALDRGNPDIVLLDLNLNDYSTLPVVEQLRLRSVPFVIISGYAELRLTEPLLADIPMIAKPWNRSLLLKTIYELLQPRSI